MLTHEQNRKKVLDDDLNKLLNLKKPSPTETQRMLLLEAELYKVDSNISRLKRKIRSRY